MARVEKPFDRFDRDHRRVRRNPFVDRHAAAGVEGGDVVSDALPALQLQFFAHRVHPDHQVLDEARPAGDCHLLHVEADFLWPVDTGEHAGPHAGVIVQGAGADHGDAMAGRREVGQLFQNRHVGMSGTHEDQVF